MTICPADTVAQRAAANLIYNGAAPDTLAENLTDAQVAAVMAFIELIIPIPWWVGFFGVEQWFIRRFWKANFAGRTLRSVLQNKEGN
jgi:hypothetical protein